MVLDDTYGHTPVKKAFEQGDVYGIGYDEARAARRPLRLGIIGVGGVAQSKYYPAVARLRIIWEPVEIAAFATRSEGAARKVQATYGGHWYSDYRQMLANEQLDGVLVSSPDQLHAEHASAALEGGCATLIEKPITRSLVEAAQLCQLAAALNLPLMTVANKRYSPPYRRARHMIEDGPVANAALYLAKFNLGYHYVDLFESGTIHLFDLTRYLMGDVATVRAIGLNRYGRNQRRYPVDNAIASFEFQSGAVGSLATSASALSLKPWERVEVYGDHAWLAVDDQLTLTLYDSEEGPAKSWQPVVPNTLFFDEEFGGFMGLIENFLQVIRGADEPLVSGWDGYRAYELNVACHISLAQGGAVIPLPLEPASADEAAAAWLRQHGWPGG
ncbi:MAG: hypothetical protein DLM69_00525 [Candidatus Chloroheliales bacterium]|nr:MAG: hypothetical protein DLM69_00525 [Chloroflexota bacterium]